MSDPAAEKEQGPPPDVNANNGDDNNNGGEKKKREYKECGHDESEKPPRKSNQPDLFLQYMQNSCRDLVRWRD